jgi:hypothetical protein
MHRILQNAQDNGYLSDVNITSEGPRILNLHFVDDALLFLETTSFNVENFRWILVSFKQLSGMRINFSKYVLIPFNPTSAEGELLAIQLEYKLGSLPISYVDFPLHNKKLTSQTRIFLWRKLSTSYKDGRVNCSHMEIR